MRRQSGIPVQLLGVFLLLLFCAGAAAGRETNRNSKDTIGARKSVRGIPNFGLVTPTLYRGGMPSPAGLKALKKMGVEIVVDLRGTASGTERDMTTRLGMQYISIPSHCPFPSDEPWARFLELMEQNRGKKVFVHCRLGDDRTGLAVASYRMTEEGWTPDEALKEMRAFGFAYWHEGLCPGMESYEQSFPQRLANDAAFQHLPSRQRRKFGKNDSQ
jgi:tyrosine-protein phosphatase SIW14